jgi:hypothetical protein
MWTDAQEELHDNGCFRLSKREWCKGTRGNRGVIRVNHDECAVAGFPRDLCMKVRRFVWRSRIFAWIDMLDYFQKLTTEATTTGSEGAVQRS